MSVPLVADAPTDLLYLAILTGALITCVERRKAGELVSSKLVVLDIAEEITRIRADGDPR